jgi:hypothetical protein
LSRQDVNDKDVRLKLQIGRDAGVVKGRMAEETKVIYPVLSCRGERTF